MKILLPVDGSTHSTKAARYLAKHWPTDATVTLLNVDMPLSESITRWLDAQTFENFHTDNCKAALKTARRVLTQAGHACKERMLVGDPASEIIGLAEKGRYNLIVMGSHGRGVAKRRVRGSVVMKVWSTARGPGLVVR